MKRNSTVWSIITLVILVLATLAANYIGLRTNMDTGEIANTTFDNTNYFFPATYVFATIWPVIYAAILGWAVYQALPSQRDNARLRAAAPWMVVNLILNAAWVYVFGRQAFVSTLPIMIALLFTLVMAYRKLRIGLETVGVWERVLQIGLSIYLGWITVATVANTASALIAAGWNGFGISAEVWGLVMLMVGAGLAVFLYFGLHRDVVIPLVYLYAYIGIIIRYADVTLVLAGAAVAAFVLVALVVWHFVSHRTRNAALKAA